VEPRIAEKQRKAGVCYALSAEGVELPVVDITHPDFKLNLSDADITSLRAECFCEHKAWARKPKFVKQALLYLLRRQSVLMQGLKAGEGTYLSGMNTYLMKLGAENLGRGYTKPLDKRIARKPPILNIRWRLQAMAQLISEELEKQLRIQPDGPVLLVNIAGGSALDSLNALILLNRGLPDLLKSNPIRIQVLDSDSNGPLFGSRSLSALTAHGAPLHGLNITFEHLHYDWGHPARLGEILESQGGICTAVGSSEGGLFEYGNDHDILANLEMLRRRTPSNFTFSASMTLDIPDTREVIRFTRLPRRSFNLDSISDLVGRAGWGIAKILEGPTTMCVCFQKS